MAELLLHRLQKPQGRTDNAKRPHKRLQGRKGELASSSCLNLALLRFIQRRPRLQQLYKLENHPDRRSRGGS